MHKVKIIGLGIGALVATTIALPSASAQPGCTAASLSEAIGTVGAGTGAYLSSHPDADAAISDAGASANPDQAIRDYFTAHPSQWADLQGIAHPLAALRQQCSVQVAPAQIAQLFNAMAGG
jgi:heme-binding protein